MAGCEADFIVVGEKVAPGALRRDLVAVYAQWMNQLEIRRGLDYLGIATPPSQEKWVEDNFEQGAEREPEAVELTVYDRSDSAPVGSAGLFQIVHAHGRATFAIAIDGRRSRGVRHVSPGLSADRLRLAARCEDSARTGCPSSTSIALDNHHRPGA